MAPLTIETSAFRSAPTEADRLAAHHDDANRSAIGVHQPGLLDAIPLVHTDFTWVFARDGYLTAIEPGERWHTGCSIPLLAARAMLKGMETGSGAACFLDPSHAAQVRVVLDCLQPNQALICIVPEAATLSLILHCDDFSAEINRRRLWFATGEQWPRELSRLLENATGLPMPSRFIRMPQAEPALIDRLIGDAQRVFAEQSTRRTTAMAHLREAWRPRQERAQRTVCLIARSMFCLWDDAGDTLHAALTAVESHDWRCTRFDPDDPGACSPLALAQAFAESEAIVSADSSRGDAPKVAADDMPWITWVTVPRIPPLASAAPNDRLVLAEPAWADAARAAGWPEDRIAVAGWPTLNQSAVPTGAPIVMLADTACLEAPESVKEFSSHCLVWEHIREAIRRNPFALPDDIDAWLGGHAKAKGIDPETLDKLLFTTRLILPACQQGLAETLISAGMPLRLHGRGWSDLPRFRPLAAGAITSREQFRAAVSEAAAVMHAWPGKGAHQIDSLGRPVLRGSGRSKQTFLRDAKLALGGAAATSPYPAPPISAALLTSLLIG